MAREQASMRIRFQPLERQVLQMRCVVADESLLPVMCSS
jgi:hypothetical protein